MTGTGPGAGASAAFGGDPSSRGPAPLRGEFRAAGEAPLRGEAALERLAAVIDQLAGLAIPASVLERDVLPARIPGYQPRLLDELGAMGEVAWVGRGNLGRDDGRVVLYRPGREALRDPSSAGRATSAGAAAEPPAGELHQRLRERLRSRGASFYRELASAAHGAPEREVLDALWDLVWAGEVTNDTFAPLRALRWGRPKGERRPRLGRLQTAPPEAAGRWSLVAAEEGGAAADTAPPAATRAATPTATRGATERLHSLAVALLDRYGVLTREAVAAEEVTGGFGAVYPVLRAMEEAGRIRRGYFVDGLGAAQFALPGAVDRLRALRDLPDGGAATTYLLAAADPAGPYGAALPWPRRGESDRRPLQRAAGAYVALVDGAAVLYLERGGHSLQMLPAADDADTAARALRALRELVDGGRFRELVLTRVDGEAVAASKWREALESAGFVPGYRGLVLRPSARTVVPAARGLPPEALAEDVYRQSPLRRRGP